MYGITLNPLLFYWLQVQMGGLPYFTNPMHLDVQPGIALNPTLEFALLHCKLSGRSCR